MPSFLDLPPETRMAVYNILLGSSLLNTTRVLAGAKDDQRLECLKILCSIGQDDMLYDDTGTYVLWHYVGIRCNIHFADIDDLLHLASTCRLIRSELLALAWSNADITVRSHTLYMDLHCIFYDRLPYHICTFIRTLQLDARKDAWLPQQMAATCGLILRRLPHLRQVVVYIPRRVFGTHKKGYGRMLTLATLQALPLRITVNILHYIAPGDYDSYMRDHTRQEFHNFRRNWNKSADRWLGDLRARADRMRQKRRAKHVKTEQDGQVAGILEVTVKLRSLGML
jgi:hypothetical protein